MRRLSIVLLGLLTLGTIGLYARSRSTSDDLEYVRTERAGRRACRQSFYLRTCRGEVELRRVVVVCGSAPKSWVTGTSWRHRAYRPAPTLAAWQYGAPDVTSFWQMRGFQYANGDGSSPEVSKLRVVSMPLWAATAPFFVLPGLGLVRRRRRRPGHCPSCDYDLRASPERCPECGFVRGALKPLS